MSDSKSGSYAIPLLVVTLIAAVVVVGATVAFTNVRNPLAGQGTPDQRELGMHYNDGTAVITFQGGERVEPGSSLLIRVEGSGSWTWDELDADVKANDPIDAGETVGVTQVERGDTLTVIWRNGEGATRQVAKWTA